MKARQAKGGYQMDEAKRKNAFFYLLPFFIFVTAAGGFTRAAFAGIMEEPAMSQPAVKPAFSETNFMPEENFWKVSTAQARKFLGFFPAVQIPSKNTAPAESKAPEKKPFNPFKAARMIMTSA